MHKKIHKSKWCKNAVKSRIQEDISTYNNLYKISSILQKSKFFLIIVIVHVMTAVSEVAIY